MKNKLKNWFYRIAYALPFGLKKADSEIMGGQHDNTDNQSIQQETSDERVGKHLLKGELTQSVKELRYRTYKVEDESKNYEYIGNGNVIRKDSKKRTLKHIHFSQECKLLPSDVLEELERVGNYGTEEYTLNVTYNNPLVRFKLEQFATQIDVDLKNGSDVSGFPYFEEATTSLHFSSIPNGYEKKSAPFINELKKLLTVIDNVKKLDLTANKSEISAEIFSHNELASSMNSLSFTTFKATNDEPDLNVYSFVNPTVIDGKEENNEIIITFKWLLCTCIDIKSKFYDATMDEKYQNKAPKDISADITGGAVRVAHCEVCGKEMNTYDADIIRYTYGKAMCENCLNSYLKNNKE